MSVVLRHFCARHREWTTEHTIICDTSWQYTIKIGFLTCVFLRKKWLDFPKYSATKDPIGHIAHLRNHFKSRNKYDIINMLIWKKTHALSHFWKLNGPYLLNLESPSHNDALCLNLLKLAQWFWMRRFSNFANVFSLFSPFVKRCGPSFEQTWNPIIQECCVQGLVAISTMVLEKEI